VRVALGSDHRGLELKREVANILRQAGHKVDDLGTHGEGPVDYPDVAAAVGKAVTAGTCQRGILICGTGIGMSMAANKVAGIRAALCHNTFQASRARQHNDANVLCLSAEEPPADLAGVLTTFLETTFLGGRHQRRVDKMDHLERRARETGPHGC